MLQESNQPIEAVIFDLDGLMIDSEPLSWKAWNRMLKPFGATLSYQEYQSIIGFDSKDSAWILREQVNLDLEIDEIVERHDALRLEIIAQEAEPMEGLLPLLRELGARELLLGVASNSPTDYVITALERIGLKDRMQVIIGVDQVKHGKPRGRAIILPGI
jgi:beta-phosphoglucomutase-like phosphatase (HAD superfamily)